MSYKDTVFKNYKRKLFCPKTKFYFIQLSVLKQSMIYVSFFYCSKTDLIHNKLIVFAELRKLGVY